LSVIRSDVTFLGYPQHWRPLGDISPTGRYTDQGNDLAAAAISRVRESGQTESDPDLPGVVEQCFGIDVSVAELGTDFDGLAVSSDEVKLILLARSPMPARQRFTLAHELGHLLTGDNQELHLDQDVYDSGRKRDPSEIRANAFAAAFLMPEESLRTAAGSKGLTDGQFAALALELGVSPSALAYRLLSLRLIDAGTCDRFRALTAKKAAQLANQGEGFAQTVSMAGKLRPPGLLVRDTYAAYDSGAATLRPYASLIGVDLESLRAALESEQPAAET
jgi:Zn-dependent peptidase ImmA (M78 family)